MTLFAFFVLVMAGFNLFGMTIAAAREDGFRVVVFGAGAFALFSLSALFLMMAAP